MYVGINRLFNKLYQGKKKARGSHAIFITYNPLTSGANKVWIPPKRNPQIEKRFTLFYTSGRFCHTVTTLVTLIPLIRILIAGKATYSLGKLGKGTESANG